MNGAVLDSGRNQNVCGFFWLNSYLGSLIDDDKSIVIENESHTVFKFGDGKLFKSLKSVTTPAKIGHKNIKIVTDVIDSELPLLLSKKEMQVAKTKIDFDNDIINIFGQDIKISFTASGYYFIPISRTNQAIVDIAEDNNYRASVLLSIADISSESDDEKFKISRKLHCQFGYASASKLQKLIKASSINDDELVKLFVEIENCYEICTIYKQPGLKPIVGFSLSKEFNDTVSVDLNEISGIKFLHIIDNAIRFNTAAVMRSKQKEEIVDT